MKGTFSSTNSAERRLKVALVGAPGVGKTAIVNHWAELPPSDHYQPTQGVREVEVRRDFMKDHNACLVFLDVGSHVVEDRDRAAAVVREADVVLLVYHCRRLQESVKMLTEKWMRLLINWLPQTPAVLLSVGNRRDMTNNYARALAREEEEMLDSLPCPTKDALHCLQGGDPASDDAVLKAVFTLAYSSPVEATSQ